MFNISTNTAPHQINATHAPAKMKLATSTASEVADRKAQILSKQDTAKGKERIVETTRNENKDKHKSPEVSYLDTQKPKADTTDSNLRKNSLLGLKTQSNEKSGENTTPSSNKVPKTESSSKVNNKDLGVRKEETENEKVTLPHLVFVQAGQLYTNSTL